MLKKISLVLFIYILLGGFVLRPNKDIIIEIKPSFNNKPLILEKEKYHTQNGDSIYIDRFRFYISSLKLYFANGNIFEEKNSYHLIDAEDSLRLFFKLPDVPQEQITKIEFNIGVDSLANVSGALGGDLDPVNGMYWAWNSGYINAKLEGRSKSCKTLHNTFEFHIGGYLNPYKSIQHVSLPLNNNSNKIILKANAAAWFKNIQLNQTNKIVMPNAQALMMAENYKLMFEAQ